MTNDYILPFTNQSSSVAFRTLGSAVVVVIVTGTLFFSVVARSQSFSDTLLLILSSDLLVSGTLCCAIIILHSTWSRLLVGLSGFHVSNIGDSRIKVKSIIIDMEKLILSMNSELTRERKILSKIYI